MSTNSIKIEAAGISKTYSLDSVGSRGNSLSSEDITEAVYSYLEKNPVEGMTTAKVVNVTLKASKWTGDTSPYSQVVSIEGVTKNSQVDLTPSAEQLAVFHGKDLGLVAENNNGTVTVYAIGQKPQNDYVMQATITEVNV